MRFGTIVLCGIVALGLSLADRAGADTVLTNLPPSSFVSQQVLTSTVWTAVELSTPSSSHVFSSMDVYIESTASFIGDITGGIFNDSSGSPGALATGGAFNTVNVPANSAATEYEFVTSSAFTLQANSAYWFVLHDSSGNPLWVSDGATPTASGGFSSTGFDLSTNSGGA